MEDGKKVALGFTVIMILAFGVRWAFIYKANHDPGPSITTSKPSVKYDDDDLVYLKKQHPDSLKDERALIGKTIWVSAADQMDYYHVVAHRADYAHIVGTLEGAVPLIVTGVIEQVPPKGRAVARIPAGVRHVLLTFTMPKSSDPKAEYAVPVGNYDGSNYNFLTDEIFFYDDPHELYKHWGAETWAHIDKHEAALGMSENQAMMALGQVIDPQGPTIGQRTVTYDNNGHPVTIDFDKNKAVRIMKGDD